MNLQLGSPVPLPLHESDTLLLYPRPVKIECDVKPITDKDIAILPLSARTSANCVKLEGVVRAEAAQAYPTIFSDGSDSAKELAIDLGQVRFKLMEAGKANDWVNHWEGIYRRNKEVFKRNQRHMKYKDKNQATLALSQQQLLLERPKLEVEVQEKLKATTLDYFIKKYFLTEGGTAKLKLAAEEMRFHGFDVGEELRSVLSESIKHLRAIELRDYREYGEYFAYKQHPENLRLSNFQILSTLINEAFCDQRGSFSGEIQGVALGLLDLHLRISRNSVPNTEEKTPFLAYVYDYFFVAAASSEQEILKTAARWVTDHLHGKSKEVFLRDYLQNSIESAREIRELHSKLNRLVKERNFSHIAFLLVNPPEDILAEVSNTGSAVGKYSDRSESFYPLSDLLQSWGIGGVFFA